MRRPPVLLALLTLLAACGGEPDVDALVEGLDRGTHAERLEAAMGLAALGAEGVAPLRERLLRDAPAPTEGVPFRVDVPESVDGRHYAAQGLGALGPDGVPALLDALTGNDEIARVEAQRVLAGLTLDDRALDRLGAALNGSNVMAAARAGELIAMLPPDAAKRALGPALRNESAFFRRYALRTAAKRSDELGTTVLIDALADTERGIREEAARLAGDRLAGGRGSASLREALAARLAAEEDEGVATWVATALSTEPPEDLASWVERLSGDATGARLAERVPGLLAAWGRFESPVPERLEALVTNGAPRASVRAVVALAALLERARSTGKPWLDPIEVSAARERWARRAYDVARGDDPAARLDALSALGVFPEFAADSVPLLRAALEGDHAESALVAIVAADSLPAPAIDDLRPFVSRWRESESDAVRAAAEAWWQRHGGDEDRADDVDVR